MDDKHMVHKLMRDLRNTKMHLFGILTGYSISLAYDVSKSQWFHEKSQKWFSKKRENVGVEAARRKCITHEEKVAADAVRQVRQLGEDLKSEMRAQVADAVRQVGEAVKSEMRAEIRYLKESMGKSEAR